MSKSKSKPTTIDKLNGVDLLALPPGQYQDGKGLSLQVSATARAWVFRYTDPDTKKPRNKGFGSLDRVDLQAARLKRDNARLRLDAGEHPFPTDAAEEKQMPTFLAIATAVIATETETVRSQKTKDKWDRDLLVRAKALHDRPINEITTNDITELLKPIWLVKQPTAAEFRRRLEKVFSRAIADELIERNPAALKDNIQHKLKKQSHTTKHQPAMPHGEVPAFMGRLEAYEALSALALMFTILSCARTDEVLTARWDDIGLDNNERVWDAPDMRKNGLMSRIPLTTAMVALLRRIKAMKLCGTYVFPGKEDGHLSSDTMLKLLQRAMKRPDCTVHGFRASFRSWGQKHRIDKDTLEYCLHHIEGSRTEQAYMREECLDERRAVLEQWSSYCLPYAPALRLAA